MYEVSRGNWRRYNLTAIREDPKDNVMLSFDFAFNRMFVEEYKALKYPYESSNAFFGTFGGFLFFLIMLYYMLYGAASAVLGLDRGTGSGAGGAGNFQRFNGSYDAPGAYAAGPSTGTTGGFGPEDGYVQPKEASGPPVSAAAASGGSGYGSI